MPKNLIPLAHNIRPTRPTSRRSRVVCILVVTVVLVPIIVEGAVVMYSQWSEAMGRSTQVYTPITTAVTAGLENARESVWDPVSTSIARAFRIPDRAAGRPGLDRAGDRDAETVARVSRPAAATYRAPFI